MKPINNIQNLSVAELIETLYNSNNNVFVSNADLKIYFKQVTNDFQLDILDTIRNDIIRFAVTKMRMNWFGKKIYLDDVYHYSFEKIRGFAKKQDAEIAFKYIKRYWERGEIHLYIHIVAFGGTMFSESVYFENNIGAKKIVNLISMIEVIIKKEKSTNEIDNIENRATKKIPNKEIKKNNFKDLFKKKYYDLAKIDNFKEWLKLSDLINENYKVACDYSNFAKIYFLLQDEGIFLPNTPIGDGITAFFKEFGVDVVDAKDQSADTPQITRVAVTNGTAQDFKYLLSYDKNEKIYNNAVKVINEIFKTDK